MISPISAVSTYFHGKPRKAIQCHIFQIGSEYQVRAFVKDVGLVTLQTMYKTKEAAQRQVDRMMK